MAFKSIHVHGWYLFPWQSSSFREWVSQKAYVIPPSTNFLFIYRRILGFTFTTTLNMEEIYDYIHLKRHGNSDFTDSELLDLGDELHEEWTFMDAEGNKKRYEGSLRECLMARKHEES